MDEQWIAYIGGASVWSGDDGHSVVGDAVGPFGTWEGAAEYLLDAWPLLEGRDDVTDEDCTAARLDHEACIRPLLRKEDFTSIRIDDPVLGEIAADAILNIAKDTIAADAADPLAERRQAFWATHPVT